jgi:hypothetical protein
VWATEESGELRTPVEECTLFMLAVTREDFRLGSVLENGGQRRIRTADASLFRAALYQLSYLAIGRR